MDNQERHYSSHKLSIVFAVASVSLLVTLVLVFHQDHDRQWKHYQREFQKLEKVKTAEKLYQEIEAVESTAEYKSLLAQMEQAQATLAEQQEALDPLKKTLAEKTARYEIVTKQYQFAKAQYDADKYVYETALGHHDATAPALGNALAALESKLTALSLDQQDAKAELDAVTEAINQYTAQTRDQEKALRRLSASRDLLARKLKKIDPARMDFANKIAAGLRNQPVVDMLNPSIKIEQTVIKNIQDDVNFMGVAKVDRCMSCHQGILNPDYQDAPQPFKTHPNLELYLSSNSAHPVEEFGCTSCHNGRGRGTSFSSAAHTPGSQEQAKEWKQKYDWEALHHWERPMFARQHVEAGCFKCHEHKTTLPGAEKLSLGLQLIEKSGCYGCHTIQKYQGWPKPAPSLKKLPAKVSREWAWRWIDDPSSFKSETWMPSFFHQTNTDDAASQYRSQQEIHAMVAYLFTHQTSFDTSPLPFNGDVKNGEALVNAIGCLACHQIDQAAAVEETTPALLRQQHGPQLFYLGSKTNAHWLFQWLKNPAHYSPETKMPNLRLSDREASDITAFLMSRANPEFENKSIPPVDEGEITAIVTEFYSRMMPVRDAKLKARDMPLANKLDFAGEKLIRHYGCAGCHDIAGFENEKPIGTELTEEGDKPADKLDFGNVHEIAHTPAAWFEQKLKNPRLFDRAKVKGRYDKLKMPNFHFTDQETDAIVTALLGFVKDRPEIIRDKTASTDELFTREGQKLIRQLNCQGCHTMEGEGGDIQAAVKNWLVTFEGKSSGEADALKGSFSPPNLTGEGKKVQPDWLFHFLKSPTPIRPWLKVRMPTFTLDDGQANALVTYFNYLDHQPFPFDSYTAPTLTPEEVMAGQRLFSPDYFGCVQCHIVGDKMPDGSPENWAPNFALAHKRLKPAWIIQWLKDPQAVMPGTKMPTFFDPQYFDMAGPDDILDGDENRQLEVMRDYLMSLQDVTTKAASSDEETIMTKENKAV